MLTEDDKGWLAQGQAQQEKITSLEQAVKRTMVFADRQVAMAELEAARTAFTEFAASPGYRRASLRQAFSELGNIPTVLLSSRLGIPNAADFDVVLLIEVATEFVRDLRTGPGAASVKQLLLEVGMAVNELTNTELLEMRAAWSAKKYQAYLAAGLPEHVAAQIVVGEAATNKIFDALASTAKSAGSKS